MNEKIEAECKCGWKGYAGDTHYCMDYIVSRIDKLEKRYNEHNHSVENKVDNQFDTGLTTWRPNN
jgi:hypothetical protein